MAWSFVAVQQALHFQGSSDAAITDDSPQVVDVAASSNQGRARLATSPDRQSHEGPPPQATEARAVERFYSHLIGTWSLGFRYVWILKILAPHCLKSMQVEESPHKKAKQSLGSGPSCFALWHIDLAIWSDPWTSRACQGEPTPATSSFALQAVRVWGGNGWDGRIWPPEFPKHWQ